MQYILIYNITNFFLYNYAELAIQSFSEHNNYNAHRYTNSTLNTDWSLHDMKNPNGHEIISLRE